MIFLFIKLSLLILKNGFPGNNTGYQLMNNTKKMKMIIVAKCTRFMKTLLLIGRCPINFENLL